MIIAPVDSADSLLHASNNALTGEAETWLGLACGAAGVVFLVIAAAVRP